MDAAHCLGSVLSTVSSFVALSELKPGSTYSTITSEATDVPGFFKDGAPNPPVSMDAMDSSIETYDLPSSVFGEPPEPSRVCIFDRMPREPVMSKCKHTCRICQQIFKTSDMLEQHAKRTLHRVYTCPVESCKRNYYRRDVYIRHKSTHEQKASHVCYLCATEGQDKAFKRKDHLNQHLRNCHPRMTPSPVSADGFNTTSECAPHHSGRPPPNRNGFQQCGFKDQNGFQEYEPIFGAGNLTTQQIPSDSFRSSAAAKLEEALTDIVVDGHDLRVLKEKLDLHNRSTPEQLASNLRKLVEAS